MRWVRVLCVQVVDLQVQSDLLQQQKDNIVAQIEQLESSIGRYGWPSVSPRMTFHTGTLIVD
jgi:hypothetical protein